ncbi:Kv channel-interacting protein 4-like isoform X1 [Wyeomyia smithii]|uniref:Kv channel-interacting protein 4-like isoform X1 n=1 Tax=Wyeomyia smithii TaxID=174621 RepID=UPI002467DF4D|nr:Kv channel-interacting protein 4-like isoform X1 [Wyeomyia smithii]XP_055550506.1 Kv channel-interacting protein 4-like isoform X1 [Wyeomyia smithii]XP_055550507.1 Kv channel-interacting protein 4-like isoform X1 [Wyeomyia smithii]XP_055550508.1 Kv channel-interacting protein 4-like isoform X1 [Wyeomyia smithii]
MQLDAMQSLEKRLDVAEYNRGPVMALTSRSDCRSPHGFTAIDVELEDTSCTNRRNTEPVYNITLNNNGTNNDVSREHMSECRRRRPQLPRGIGPRSQSQNVKSSRFRDCLLCKCCNKNGTERANQLSDGEENELENLDCELEEIVTPPKYRPESIAALCAATRFTEAEIKRIYRGFKAECPAGIIREETFKFIYSQFFPQGANTGLYAHYVFNTLDKDHTGILSFENFVQGLSILSRGSLEEKLCWTFSLYDINHDGKITREEMTDIVIAIYELMGAREDGGSDDAQIKSKVEKVFQKMDTNCDGVITIEEFLDCCRKDQLISDSMGVFDSTI